MNMKNHKLISIIIIIVIIFVTYFFIKSNKSLDVENIVIDGKKYDVVKISLEKPWTMKLHYNEIIPNLENWKKSILVYDSNYAALLDDAELLPTCEIGKTHPNDTLKLINGTIKRFNSIQTPEIRTINHLLIAKNDNKNTYLIIPIVSEYGTQWSSRIWIDDSWKFGTPSVTGRTEFGDHSVKIDKAMEELSSTKKIANYPSSKMNNIISEMTKN